MLKTLIRLFVSMLFFEFASLSAFSQTIVYGFDHKFKPYEFLDENKMPAGYNIDIVKEIAKELGYEVRFLPGVWSDIKYKLEYTNEVNIVSMFYTIERDTLLDFTIPFNIVYHSIFRRKDEFEFIKEIKDLEGLRVAAQKSTIFIDYIRKNRLNIELIEIKDDEDAINLLSNGKCDAIVVAHVPAVKYIEEQGIDNLEEAGKPVFPGHYSLAVKENNEKLLRNLNIAIANLKINGTFAKVEQKWFPKHYSFFNSAYFLLFASVAGTFFLILFIWNRALYFSIRKKTAQLENSNYKLQRISELNSKLLVTNPNLFEYLTDLRNLFQIDYCGISGFKEGIETIFSGIEVFAEESLLFKKQIFAELESDFKPIIIPSIAEYCKKHYLPENKVPEGAYCAFPMVSENKLHAVFEVLLMNNVKGLNASDIAYLQIVALNLSTFIEKENLTSENQKQRAAMLKEVEDRLVSEEKLYESQERYGAIFETAEDAIIVTTIDGKHLFRNKSFYSSMGYTETEAENIANWAEVHPDDLQVLLNEIPMLQRRGSLSTEYRVKHRNGTWVYRAAKSTLIHDAKGNPYQALVIIRDITERKKTEQQLLENEKMLNRVGFIAKIGGWRTDKEFAVSSWTKEIYNILEILEPDNELTFEKFRSFINPGYIEHANELFESLLGGNKQEGSVKFMLTTEAGSTIWCELVAKVEYENGRISGIFGTLQNIHNQQVMEQSLVKYKNNLEKLVEQRTKELEDSVAELSRLNNLFIGREFRIKELRMELDILKEKLKRYE